MNPALLDALIASNRKDGDHGDRNCPKCGLGYMRHVESSLYACLKCAWMEDTDGPWIKVSERTSALTRKG